MSPQPVGSVYRHCVAAKDGVGPQKVDVQGHQLLRWVQRDRRPSQPAPARPAAPQTPGAGGSPELRAGVNSGLSVCLAGAECPKGCRAPSTAARIQAVPLGRRLQEGGARLGEERVFPARSWGHVSPCTGPSLPGDVRSKCADPGAGRGPQDHNGPLDIALSLGKVTEGRSVRGRPVTLKEHALSTSGSPGPAWTVRPRPCPRASVLCGPRVQARGQAEQERAALGRGWTRGRTLSPQRANKGSKAIERLRKKLSEQESLLLLMSPNMAFRVHSRNGKVSDHRPHSADHAPHRPRPAHRSRPYDSQVTPTGRAPPLPVTPTGQAPTASLSPTCRSHPVGHAPPTDHARLASHTHAPPLRLPVVPFRPQKLVWPGTRTPTAGRWRGLQGRLHSVGGSQALSARMQSGSPWA